jgi:hypothetical protein
VRLLFENGADHTPGQRIKNKLRNAISY